MLGYSIKYGCIDRKLWDYAFNHPKIVKNVVPFFKEIIWNQDKNYSYHPSFIHENKMSRYQLMQNGNVKRCYHKSNQCRWHYDGSISKLIEAVTFINPDISSITLQEKLKNLNVHYTNTLGWFLFQNFCLIKSGI